MSFKPILRAALLLASSLISIALMFGFLGSAHRILDSFSHFRAHLGFVLLLCALLLFGMRYKWTAVAALALGTVAIITTLPSPLFSFGTAQAALPIESNKQPFRLLQLNLRLDNPQPERALSLIGGLQPDVIVVEEVSPMWVEKLAPLKGDYPYQVTCNPRRYGSAILSKRPIVSLQADACYDNGALAIVSVDFDGKKVDVGAIHLRWPWPFSQNEQVGRMTDPLKTLGDTAILAGDFNAATWSATTKRVAKIGGLNIVDGVGATWIDYAFPRSMRWAGLPIDHVMVKGDVIPQGARVLQDVGSDHWPVLLEFSLRAKL